MRRFPTLWLALGLVLSACGATPVAINGRVVDQNGTPVDKAEVFTEPDTDIVLTNRRGFFSLRQTINDQGEIEPIAPGVYVVKVKKFGFDDLSVEEKIEAGPNRVEDLAMEPRSPDIVETAPEPTEGPERAPDEASTAVQGI